MPKVTVRFSYTSPHDGDRTTGWIKETNPEILSRYMDYLARGFTNIVVERKQVVDISQELSDIAWGRKEEELAK